MRHLRLLLLASVSLGITPGPPTSSTDDGENMDNNITVSVNRGLLLPDRFTVRSAMTEETHLCSENQTYLIVENQCISDKQLLRECTFALAPASDLNTRRLGLYLQMSGSSNSTLGQTATSNDEPAIALVVNNNTSLPVSGSICHISTLEVYRGREQMLKISQDGFSLNNNGTIESHIGQLAYDFEEYEGELYRMNLSCFGEELSKGGCLLFKVIGTAIITDAKFNCTVPGTRPTNTSTCPLPDMSNLTDTTDIHVNDHLTSLPPRTIKISDTLQTTTENTTQSLFEIGSPLFYVVIGVGIAIIIILTCSIICLAFFVRYKSLSKTSNYNISEGPLYEDVEESLKGKAYDLETPQYSEIGATYQELQPRAVNACFQEWEIENSTPSDRDNEQEHPPNEYHTLTQVGSYKDHYLESESATSSTDNEQYSQLQS